MKNNEDVMKFTDHANTSPTTVNENLGGFTSIHDFFVDDTKAEDPVLYNDKLHNDPPLLLSDENVIKIFRSRRDKVIYTNKRLILVDVKGITGKKIQYLSIPIEYISTFSVETAGHLDNEAEVYLHTNCSKETIQQDILVKYFDIMEMHEYLTTYLLFGGSNVTTY